MVRISQRCQYALRACMELALSYGNGPVPVSRIAEPQTMPRRFLEVIVNDLRRAGIVTSRRGAKGGYSLAISPEDLTIGQVIRLFDGDFRPVDCQPCGGTKDCPQADDCLFSDLWRRAEMATAALFNSTTFAVLANHERQAAPGQAGSRLPIQA